MYITIPRRLLGQIGYKNRHEKSRDCVSNEYIFLIVCVINSDRFQVR